MPLYKLADFDNNYQETFGGNDIKSLDLYTEGEIKIGSVADVLVDHEGKFRYLAIDVSIDSIDKTILLPIGLSRIDYNRDRVYVDGLNKQQVEHLPEYREDIIADYDYEEKVRQAYRSTSNDVNYDRNTYNYQQDANLYDLDARENQTFKLYEERLIANKNRIKKGEVSVGKHIELETQTISVPVEKERVVIERIKPSPSNNIVDSKELKFQEGEVARIELYEETPNISKETFVREEIHIKKVIDEETVERQETIRREELDVDTQGNLNMDETNLS
ncbi:DUF2382 domain-containing protein [Brunnivagina elsteri]|uniref:Photosystem reaction center subunit H n=1 Tax=Brunnivagina elsteri CCALA 953 TaxID=987040 RepID=A0A2A2TJI8_9CYAN|nr:DUF2382 domain-containing protein [Calothrix elsteri]PAX53827.1 photosystem reaction center subunit H [Calothrix elsteri CCALA 953]